MIILGMIFQLCIVAAMTIMPALGIGETYGAAMGWFSFFVLAALFAIAFELQQMRQKQEKRIAAEAARAKLGESYAADIRRYQGDIVLALKELNENVNFIKEQGRR